MVIAGGTGFVGGEVVRLFERLGYETFVISRTPRVNTAKTSALFSDKSKSEFKNVRTWDDIEVELFVMVAGRRVDKFFFFCKYIRRIELK